jgi:hypothetical protein
VGLQIKHKTKATADIVEQVDIFTPVFTRITMALIVQPKEFVAIPVPVAKYNLYQIKNCS